METKQHVISDIAHLLGTPVRQAARGSTEPKEVFVDVIERLGLPISTALRKPQLAQAIATHAGVPWDDTCDSRTAPSGGGDTITLIGLQRVRSAVQVLISGPPPEVGPASVEHGVVDRIRLRPAVSRLPAQLAVDAFSASLMHAEQRDLVEAALISHQQVVNSLIEALSAAGASCHEDPASVDLLARWPGMGTLLVEVKTLTSELVSQMRVGLAQVYEYAFRLRTELDEPVMLALAFDGELHGPPWLVPYLTDDRDLNLIWQGRADALFLRGPDEALLRRLAPALRRPT